MSNNNLKKEGKEKGTDENRFIQRFRAVAVLAVIGLVGFFVYSNSVTDGAKYPFKLGLDLAGGSHLVYEADVSEIAPE